MKIFQFVLCEKFWLLFSIYFTTFDSISNFNVSFILC